MPGGRDFALGVGTAVGAKVKQLEVEIPAGTNADSIQAIHIDGYSLIQIITPGLWSPTNINILSAHTETDSNNPTGSYVILNDSNGVRTAIVNSQGGQAYVFVNDKATTIAGCKWIRIRSVDTQTTTKILKITLKG